MRLWHKWVYWRHRNCSAVLCSKKLRAGYKLIRVNPVTFTESFNGVR